VPGNTVYSVSFILMHSTPFLIDVGDLLTHSGEIRSVEFSGAVEARVAQARVIGPVEVRARLEGLTDGVYMVARAEVPAGMTCNRCLTEWEEALEIEVRQLFAREPDEDGYGVHEHWIDTEGPIRDEAVLAHLNTAPCQGHEEAESSPFAGLKDLLSD